MSREDNAKEYYYDGKHYARYGTTFFNKPNHTWAFKTGYNGERNRLLKLGYREHPKGGMVRPATTWGFIGDKPHGESSGKIRHFLYEAVSCIMFIALMAVLFVVFMVVP